MIEKFEYNNEFKNQRPCANYNIFIASLEVDHCYAVLTWCWDSDDDTSILLETYVNSDKADEAVLDESKDDIFSMDREEIYRFLEEIDYETSLANREDES